jgi:hypothetical protein
MTIREQVLGWRDTEREKNVAFARASGFAVQYEQMRQGDSRIENMAALLEDAATALRMVTPGVWHEVDEWLAAWRGGAVPYDLR